MTLFYNHKSQTPKRQALRKNIPEPEKRLWQKLRKEQLIGIKFRRQYSVGPYVIDFYSPKTRLGIEIDGDSHFWGDTPAYDKERQIYIEANGIKLIRFTNREVIENLEGVLEKITIIVMAPGSPPLKRGED